MKSIGYDEPYEEELYDFSTALDELKKWLKVTRKGWHWKDMYLQLQRPDQFSKMTLPYIYMVIPQWENKIDNLVPWIASQTDLLTEDWIILI